MKTGAMAILRNHVAIVSTTKIQVFECEVLHVLGIYSE